MVWRVSCRDFTYIKTCFILFQWLEKKSTAFILLVIYAYWDNEPWSCETPALSSLPTLEKLTDPNLSGGNQHPPSRAISWDSSSVARRSEPAEPQGFGGGWWGPIELQEGDSQLQTTPFPHNFWVLGFVWPPKVDSFWVEKTWSFDEQRDSDLMNNESYGVMEPGLLEDTLSWRCDCKWMCKHLINALALTFLLFPTTNIHSIIQYGSKFQYV